MLKLISHIICLLILLVPSVPCSAQVITTFAGSRHGGFIPDGDTATAFSLSYTTAVRVGPQGDLYLIDHNRIRKIDANTRTITTIAGNGEVGFSGDGGPAVHATFRYVIDFFIDEQENIYVCDKGNNRIRKVDGTTGNITTIAGDGTSTYIDSFPALSTGISQPTSITADGKGNLYVACSGYTSYTGDNYIYRMNLSTGTIIKIAGNGTGAYAAGGTPGLETGFYTTGICADATGNIYFADPVHNCILKLIASTGKIHTFAGTGTRAGFGYDGDNGPALDAKLNQPVNMCFDADGNLLIVDGGNSLIRKIDMTTEVISTVAGMQARRAHSVGGEFGYSGDGGPAACAKLHLFSGHFYPSGMAADRTGNFYFADQGNKLIRMVDHSVLTIVNPTVSITASDSAICLGQQVVLKSTVSQAGDTVVNPPVYQWIKNGSLTGKGSAVHISNSLENQDTVYCKVQTTNNVCLPATLISNKIVFTTRSSVVPIVKLSPGDTAVCPGESVAFEALVRHGGNQTTYQWQLNGSDLPVHDSVLILKDLKNADKINCVVTTNAPGCPELQEIYSDTSVVSIKPLPQVTLFPEDTIIEPGTSIQLQAISITPLVAYQWAPATGLNDALSLKPVARPEKTTRYYFKATSTNSCSIEKSLLITLATPVYMPTAFTPNGDGNNDVFRIPVGTFFDLIEFSVYDRWGKRVFLTVDIDVGWDGTYQGAQVPSGMYVYFIEGRIDNKPVKRKGTVLLIR